ncbi:MAG: hypothetical protein AAGL34_13905 [Bacteroidota bacterium]
MDALRKAKNKDKILDYLYKERQFAMPVSDIAMGLFQNTIDAKTVMDLCHEIIDFDTDLLTETMVGTKMAFQANSNSLSGISFVEMVEHGKRKEKVEDLKQQERNKKQDEISELQRKDLELTYELNKQSLKTHRIPIIISGISALIALGALGWSIFKPSNQPIEPVDDSRLRNIEMKMEQLENGLKKDLDSLQNELYEAQMLIDSYES